MENQCLLDLYLLATQGQFSPDRNEYWTPDGFYIFIEEEIITVTRRGGSGGGYDRREIKKKRITLHVNGDGVSFKETFLVSNINLKVTKVSYDTLENLIKVDLSDIRFEDVKKTINISPKS